VAERETPAARIADDLPADWQYHERLPATWDRQFAAWVIEQVIAGREPTLWRLLELDWEKYFLLVIEGVAHLIRFGDGEAELQVLGALAGGRYSEKLRVNDDGNAELHLRFEHELLPGPIEIVETTEQHLREERLNMLRGWLRERGSTPAMRSESLAGPRNERRGASRDRP
jgi:hypothetical protein